MQNSAQYKLELNPFDWLTVCWSVLLKLFSIIFYLILVKVDYLVKFHPDFQHDKNVKICAIHNSIFQFNNKTAPILHRVEPLQRRCLFLSLIVASPNSSGSDLHPFFILKSPLLSLLPFSFSPACSSALPNSSMCFLSDSSYYWRASSLSSERVPNSLRNPQEPLHFMIRVLRNAQV